MDVQISTILDGAMLTVLLAIIAYLLGMAKKWGEVLTVQKNHQRQIDANEHDIRTLRVAIDKIPIDYITKNDFKEYKHLICVKIEEIKTMLSDHRNTSRNEFRSLNENITKIMNKG